MRSTKGFTMGFLCTGGKVYGAGDRIRTGDIDLGKVALYQLSYSRSTQNSIFAGNIPDVKRYG